MYATRYPVPYALDTDRPMRLESRVVYARREAETRLPAIDEAPGIETDPGSPTARVNAHNGNPINVQPVPRRRRVNHPRAEAGHLTQGGPIDQVMRSFACADCKAPVESTSPNAQRCATCSKAHTRKLQAEWMRKKRGKG